MKEICIILLVRNSLQQFECMRDAIEVANVIVSATDWIEWNRQNRMKQREQLNLTLSVCQSGGEDWI